MKIPFQKFYDDENECSLKELEDTFSYPKWPEMPKSGSMVIVDDTHKIYKIVTIDSIPSILIVRKNGTYFCASGWAMPLAQRDTMERVNKCFHDLVTAFPQASHITWNYSLPCTTCTTGVQFFKQECTYEKRLNNKTAQCATCVRQKGAVTKRKYFLKKVQENAD